MRFRYLCLTLGLFYTTSIATGSLWAAEMRQFNAIRTPAKVASLLPVSAEPVAEVAPVAIGVVAKAIREFAAAWNTPAVFNMITDDFVDKSILQDSTATNVPRDAKLKILAIQGVQTLQQARLKSPTGKDILLSTVIATVRTQIEFNDPTSGFVRLEGTNDYFLEVKEELG